MAKPSSFEKLLQSNNRGVRLMGRDLFDHARKAFHEASSCLTEILRQKEREYSTAIQLGGDYLIKFLQKQHDHADPASAQGFALLELPEDKLAPPANHTHPYAGSSKDSTHHRQECTPSSPSDDSSLFFLFLRPIVFNLDEFLRASSPPLIHISICIIFNHAVANHALVLNPLEQPHHRQAALKEALALYQWLYTTQVETNVEVSRLHTLAILNNMGHLLLVCSEAGLHDAHLAASRECFRLLMHLISVDQVVAQVESPSLSPEVRASSFTLSRMAPRISPSPSRNKAVSVEAPFLELFLDNVSLMGLAYGSGGFLAHPGAA